MIVTMYRRKWKFSVMSAEDAEDFIRKPHLNEFGSFLSLKLMAIILIFISVKATSHSCH